MTVAITYDGAVPTVGADADIWGDKNNTALGEIKVDLDNLASASNTNETAVATATTNAATAQTTANRAAPPGVIVLWADESVPTGSEWTSATGGCCGRERRDAVVAMPPDTGGRA